MKTEDRGFCHRSVSSLALPLAMFNLQGILVEHTGCVTVLVQTTVGLIVAACGGCLSWAIRYIDSLVKSERSRKPESVRSGSPRYKPTAREVLTVGERHHVNKWVALADLARIPSVGCQYCGLLLHAGISSAAQLAQTPLHRLHQQILRLQVATLQRRDLCPPQSEMQAWIHQARSLCGLR